MKDKKFLRCFCMSFLFLVLVGIIPIFLSGCFISEIVEIEVVEDSLPKTSIEVGQLNVSTVKIKVKRSDNSETIMNCSPLMFSEADLSKLDIAGNHTLTVRFAGQTSSFSISIYPYGNPPIYTIKFIGDYTDEIPSGEIEPIHVFEIPIQETFSQIPNVPVKTGYTAVWSITDFEDIREDTNVYAIYTPNSYTITYKLNNGMLDNGTSPAEVKVPISFGSTVGEMPKVSRSGFVFMGWFATGQVKWNSSMVYETVGDIVLTATWERLAVTSISANPEQPIPSEFFVTSTNTNISTDQYSVIGNYNDGTTAVIPLNNPNIRITDFSTLSQGSRTATITYINPNSSVQPSLTFNYTVYNKFEVKVRMMKESSNNFGGTYEVISLNPEIQITKTTEEWKTYTYDLYTFTVSALDMDSIRIIINPNSENKGDHFVFNTIELQEDPEIENAYKITKLTNPSDVNIRFKPKDHVKGEILFGEELSQKVVKISEDYANVSKETEEINETHENIEFLEKTTTILRVEFDSNLVEKELEIYSVGCTIISYTIEDNALIIVLETSTTNFSVNLSNSGIEFDSEDIDE